MKDSERIERHANAVPLINRLRGESFIPGVHYASQTGAWMWEAAVVLSTHHVFTDAELRARDERIIRAALDWWDADGSYHVVEEFDDDPDKPLIVLDIIGEAEADQ